VALYIERKLFGDMEKLMKTASFMDVAEMFEGLNVKEFYLLLCSITLRTFFAFHPWSLFFL